MPVHKRTKKISHKKKQLSGLHHNKGKQYAKIYWPYIPLLLIIAFGSLMAFQPVKKLTDVLAYTTDASHQRLLESTNDRRLKHDKAALTLNQQLNKAAQAKAEDMVARDYWSHNTPDGQEPWIFVEKSGYVYEKAGENLAYGFYSSDMTVTGWMNSQTHRDNLLDPAFREVGFGFANSDNYQGKGEITVVVAMYGDPIEDPVPVTAVQPVERIIDNSPLAETTSQPVNRLDLYTSNPWLPFVFGILSGGAIAILLVKHGIALRRMLVDGEHFFMHHPYWDMALLGLVVAGLYLSQTRGFIS